MFTSPVNIWSRGVRTCDLGATEWETLPSYFFKSNSFFPPLFTVRTLAKKICRAYIPTFDNLCCRSRYRKMRRGGTKYLGRIVSREMKNTSIVLARQLTSQAYWKTSRLGLAHRRRSHNAKTCVCGFFIGKIYGQTRKIFGQSLSTLADERRAGAGRSARARGNAS